MNGNSDPNYPEAGPAGAYTGAPGAGSTSNPGSYGAAPDANSYGSGPNNTAAGANYTGPGANYAGPGTNYTGPASDAYAAPGYVPPPPGYAPPYPPPMGPPLVPGAPNPGLALLLGFIPGVGAMFNGQFAKGIAHIVIFSILTSLSSHAHDPLDMIFGFLSAGWYFYMVFDAYQTARARREGLVAPDPFGLNNIGERFGMPGNPNWGDFVARPPAGTAAAADPARTSNPYAGPPTDPTAASGYGYAAPNPVSGPYVPPVPPAQYPPAPYPAAGAPPWHPEYPETVRRQAYADMGGAPTAGYQATYAPVDPAAMPPYPPQPASGIPAGAIWLIGLGVLALAGSLAHNFYWRGYFFGAAACFIFGAVLLIQQIAATRKLYPRGTAAYQWSLLHQARFGLILLLVGVLQTVAGAHITGWHYLWPYLLIFVGLLQLADRFLYNRMLLEPPVFLNGYQPVNPGASIPTATAAAEATSTATDEEVR